MNEAIDTGVAIKLIVDAALSGHKRILESNPQSSLYGTKYFQNNFQVVKISLPAHFFESDIYLQKQFSYSFLIVRNQNIKSLFTDLDKSISEDVFTLEEVLSCKAQVSIYRSLANLRGLDIIIVSNTVIGEVEKRYIFNLYKPKLLVLLGNCDE